MQSIVYALYDFSVIFRQWNKNQILIQISDELVHEFNTGINSGEVAGQTILHWHTYLTYSKLGDIKNPRVKIRHLVQTKVTIN